MARTRLNLPAINASLCAVQGNFARINADLLARRDAMDDTMVANMMAGYAFVDTAIANGTNLFAMGNLKLLLELNKLILCGPSDAERGDYAALFAATEQQFYEQRGGGIRDIVEWYALHEHESVWKRAAGVYVRVISEPQLYIEGNHRCGALIMSYILGRERRPPFVLTVDNAKAYFDPSTLIKNIKKHSFDMLFRMPKIKKTFAQFLQYQADERYLCCV